LEKNVAAACVIYGLLNNDKQRGARAARFQKLYGAAAIRADRANETTEAELDEQLRVLNEQKREYAAAAAASAKNL
jgi:hypothetical protein